MVPTDFVLFVRPALIPIVLYPRVKGHLVDGGLEGAPAAVDAPNRPHIRVVSLILKLRPWTCKDSEISLIAAVNSSVEVGLVVVGVCTLATTVGTDTSSQYPRLTIITRAQSSQSWKGDGLHLGKFPASVAAAGLTTLERTFSDPQQLYRQ